MNPEGQKCGNPECDKKMKEDRGFYALGHHVLVCSDGCEKKLWVDYRNRQQRAREVIQS